MEVKAAGNKTYPKFLEGGGELGGLIRNYDWLQTPLGDFDTWPQSLRTCIHIMLTSRQPIWIGWGKELIKFYNDPYKAIVGGKHPTALGKPASVVWQDIWKDIEPMLKQVMEQGQGTYVESQLLIMERYGYPEETYYTFSYTPIPGDDGEIAGMFCANTDDTDRIISERQLRTLTQLGKRLTDCRLNQEVIDKTIATLVENPHDFPFAIFRTITDGKASMAASTPLGSSAQIVQPEIDINSDHPLGSVLQKAIDTRKPQVFDHLLSKLGVMPTGVWQIPADKAVVLPIVQTGTKEPFGLLIVGLNPYRQLDEKYLSFFSLVADQVATSFADVHAFEQERKRAEALAEIDRAKTAFFSNISHEFRTPLTLMLAPIQDALEDPQTVPENKVRLDVAHRNLQRLLKLVNNLLEFSRIEAGRMQSRFEPVNLSELTRDLASIFRSAIERAGMVFIIECKKDIQAYVDVDMWEKIVLNLVSNAFKYTHSGSVTVSLTEQGDTIQLTISDTGVGIPKEEITKVFERFHRIQNTGGRSQEGTGIGLAMVQELVKLHQGTIEVESTVGEGSSFTITIPKGKDHLPPDQLVSDKLQVHASKASLFLEEAMKWLPDNEIIADVTSDKNANSGLKPVTGQLKVLLADDNTDMRDYLRHLLSNHYEVTAVHNGKQALEQASVIEPDLILSDVMMPVMDGFELVRNLKENPVTKNIPIILLSARAGEEATIEGLQTGADDYMVKPFSAKELLSRIDSNIKIAQSRIAAFKQLYKLFIDAPTAIAILRGSEHRFELANAKYLEMVGKTNIVGKALLEALPELKESGFTELLDSVMNTGIAYHGSEVEVNLMRNGKPEKVFCNFVYSPMQDVDGTITGVMVVVTEITDMVLARKVLEQNEERLEHEVTKRTEELRRINEALERSNKELEQYAFVTSHDLQEPLRKIQTFAHLWFEKHAEAVDDKSAYYYKKVISSAKRMSALIHDLLQFSRLLHSQPYDTVDLNNIVANVQADFELIIEEKNAVIRCDALPQIEAVPLQMNQLVNNLLANALKFSNPGVDPVIRISVADLGAAEVKNFSSLEDDREYFRLTFRDNGIGFDPSYADKIFEIFQRLNDRSIYDGTGIGLAVCQRIVANHKGIIYAEGEPHKGAAFHVVLPYRQ